MKDRKIVLKQTKDRIHGWSIEIEGVNIADYVDSIDIHISSAKKNIASVTLYMTLFPGQLELESNVDIKAMIEDLRNDGSGSQ